MTGARERTPTAPPEIAVREGYWMRWTGIAFTAASRPRTTAVWTHGEQTPAWGW
ncbi:hypothetical protein QA802_19550 [Streptomyces sp. B21-105]|uniref:hypothetical protein n=1 Tax=Streptomyces sp. B21-105 TaxID=3039417 RepID=UPI002FF038D2